MDGCVLKLQILVLYIYVYTRMERVVHRPPAFSLVFLVHIYCVCVRTCGVVRRWQL